MSLGINIDKEYTIRLMEKIINTPSPVGYFDRITEEMITCIKELGFEASKNNKGDLYVKIDGIDNSKTIALAAHLDTIGLMVSQISEDGTLRTTTLGGINYPSIEGESVIIHTRDGKEYTGVIYSDSHSLHTSPNANVLERNYKNMHIRIDEDIKNKQDIVNLGICRGDHISINPRFEYTKAGFVKSRFIDDKGCVAAVMSMLKALRDNNIKPQYKTICIFTQYEEIGYGGAVVPAEVSEYIAIDIGLVSPEHIATEHDISICAKDAMTVYDRSLVTKLINIAKENDLSYQVDTYVGAATDAFHAIRAGNDLKIAALGPYSYAAHSMERTHMDALVGTAKLLLGYITKQ